MSYLPANLRLMATDVAGTVRWFLYRSTDPLAAVLDPGYIADALDHDMAVGDLVLVQEAASPVYQWLEVAALMDGAADLVDGLVPPVGLAPLVSPRFNGTPLAPTPGMADATGKIATTEWVQAQAYLRQNQRITLEGDAVGTGTMALKVTTTGLRGRPVNEAAPQDGQVLTWRADALQGVMTEGTWLPGPPVGATGEKGDKGDTGDTGPQGEAGTATAGGTVGQVQFHNAAHQLAGVTMAGDATWNTTSGSLTLASVNANAGTFQGLTLNAKGQVTAAADQGYLTPAAATATYAPINAPVFTGDPRAPTPATADNDTSIATTAYVQLQGYATTAAVAATYAPLANPAFTGNPTAPTPSPGDADTSIATTAFVGAAVTAAPNKTITLSGDISGSGTAAITTTLPNVNANVGTFNNITINAKGQATAASNIAYITSNPTITITGDVDGAGTTAIALTLDTVNANVGTFASHTVNGKGLATAAGNLTGDVTTAGAAATIANSAVTLAKMQNRAASTLLGNPTGSAAAPSEITLGTNLSFAGSVLNATAAAGGLSGMTAGQIPIAATATTVTSSGNLSGAVTTSGSLATTLANNAVATAHITNANVTYAKIQNVAAQRMLGNPTGSAAAPSEVSLGTNLSFSGTQINAAGSVSSVGLSVPATSILSVTGSPVTGSATLALATTGISGGIPYFSSTSQLTSSALLTANALVKGQGAGAAPIASTATVDGSGNLVATGTVSCSSSGFYTHGSTNALNLEERTNSANVWAIYSDNASGTSAVKFSLGGEKFRLESGGVLVIAGANAYKAGGGVWLDSSDVRLKKDITPFRRGLAAVLALEPVRYRHNGRGETVDDGKVYTGLVADDVAEALPEMVGTRRVRMDDRDKDGTDVLTLDATPLIYTLLNCCKELAARIEALENTLTRKANP